jgi:alpha-tubulin suppressor-like RCC1 family protein
MGLLKSLTPYSIKKIQFFMRVVDLDILIDLSEIYGHPWSSQWLKAHSESIYSDTPIMNISAGQSHTLIVNSKQKVFVWGWNDNGQCSKPFDINEVTLNEPVIKNAEVNLDHIQNSGAGMRIKQSMAVQDRCSLLIQDTGELVTWGNNEKG